MATEQATPEYGQFTATELQAFDMFADDKCVFGDLPGRVQRIVEAVHGYPFVKAERDKLTGIRNALVPAMKALLAPGAWRHENDCRSEKEGWVACDCGYLERIEIARAAVTLADKQ